MTSAGEWRLQKIRNDPDDYELCLLVFQIPFSLVQFPLWEYLKVRVRQTLMERPNWPLSNSLSVFIIHRFYSLSSTVALYHYLQQLLISDKSIVKLWRCACTLTHQQQTPPLHFLEAKNGTLFPALMDFHDCLQTNLQFITSISSPVYLPLCSFVYLSFMLSLFFSSRSVPFLAVESVAEHIWSRFSLKRQHFVGVTSCLKGTRGGQSIILSMLGANGWANTNNTSHSCVCASVHLRDRFCRPQVSLCPPVKGPLSPGHLDTAVGGELSCWNPDLSCPLSLYPLLHPLAPDSQASQMYPPY